MSTIDPETLAAYAEGHLDGERAAAVEAAMAQDPALAAEVEAHRALKARVVDNFSPVMDAPVPDHLLALIRGGTEPVSRDDPEHVVDFAAAKAARDAAVRPVRRGFPSNRWAVGGAMAASLVLGLFIGGRGPSSQLIETSDGRLVATGALDAALTGQGSGTGRNGAVRVLLSLRDASGGYCRAFDAGAVAGIACREGGGWAIRRAEAAAENYTGAAYRQAGSADAAIMAAAQDMATGQPLDAAAEKVAIANGWAR